MKPKKQSNKIATESQLKAWTSVDHPVETDLSLDELIDLKKVLSQIKDKRTKKVFKLRINGWTLQEIADELGFTQARAKVIIDSELKRICTRLKIY